MVIFLSLFQLAYSAEPAVYTNNILDALAEAESSKKDILVIFAAPWCKYCMIMKDDITKNPSVLDGKIVCYIDYDKNEDIIKEYKVRIIPDYLIIRNRIEVKRKTGYSTFENFRKWLDQNE